MLICGVRIAVALCRVWCLVRVVLHAIHVADSLLYFAVSIRSPPRLNLRLKPSSPPVVMSSAVLPSSSSSSSSSSGSSPSYLVEVRPHAALPILAEVVVGDLVVVLDRHCICLFRSPKLGCCRKDYCRWSMVVDSSVVMGEVGGKRGKRGGRHQRKRGGTKNWTFLVVKKKLRPSRDGNMGRPGLQSRTTEDSEDSKK